MQTLQQDPRPGTWQLLGIWAGIGLQSFGGGTSTALLIQRAFIDKHHWLTIEEYSQLWNLCFFAPGINLIALTILIGQKLGGARGVLSSLIGMLLPSTIVTCLLTAAFAEVEHLHAVQAVLSGIIPATAGIMFLVGLRFFQPQMKIARQEGPLSMAASIFIILGSAFAIIIFNFPVFIVLTCTGILGAICFTRSQEETKEKEYK